MSAIIRAAGASVLAVLSLAGTAAPAGASSGASSPPGRLVLVQAVPKESFDISIDGRTVDRGSTTGAVLGPFTVTPGLHRVEFSGDGQAPLVTSVSVGAGSSNDVVVHLPAAVDGAPVVNTYRTPIGPIAPGKARVLVAHTATVAPADVRVDGSVVFHDIANGEYATAELAGGAHTVALLPAGVSGPPILGPLHVDLKPGTVTSAYAVGNPRTRSMNVIVHTTPLSSNGAAAPASIDTGSAGLVGDVRVRTFAAQRGVATPGTAATPSPRHVPGPPAWLLLLVAAGGVLLVRRVAGGRPLPPG